MTDRDRSGDPADDARLALLLEVAGTPKPGNVDRARDLPDLRFEQFLAGAVGAGAGLDRAAAGAPVGAAFEEAVAGMHARAGENTQFGCLLLLVPLVRAAAETGDGALTPAAVEEVVAGTTVDDAVAFYRAFDRVDVAVGDPPADAPALDVRRGAAAEPALRERGLTLADVMGLSAAPEEGVPDRNAQEWVEGFPRTFDAADSLLSMDGAVGERAAHVFVDLLAAEPDTLVATNHGEAVAREVSQRAMAVRGDLDAAAELAEELVAEGVNPGTTADLTCAALFVALRRGLDA
ncbi:triphosphoribosyl-dephospho-CoA synthase [Haloparvum alkalitolerans]|uniref:triphosphoribosyl-dephospho-CoA synthase n=1 Tax=Haloparvum alkalitolerans TaxID=1042953 RepID=UPI003CFB1045